MSCQYTMRRVGRDGLIDRRSYPAARILGAVRVVVDLADARIDCLDVVAIGYARAAVHDRGTFTRLRISVRTSS